MSAGLLGMLALALAGTNQIPGVEGFAQRSDVAQLQQTAQAIEARIILQDLYDTRREQCLANGDGHAATRPGIMRRMEQLLYDYKRVTGREYTVPACGDL